MRKFSLIFSMLVVLAMLLSACGGEETSTTVPPVTVDTTATGESPLGTETVMPTEPALDTTTTPGVPVTGEDNPSRITRQLDLDVWNQNGEQVGEVDDMVLDLDNNRVSYVLVGTGGFLDLGEKDVLIPWESLQLQTEPGDATGGQIAFVLQGDAEILKNAPDVDVHSVLPGPGVPANDWDADVRNFWESGGTSGGASSSSNTPSVTETAAVAVDATATATPSTGNGTGNGQGSKLQGTILASDVLGSSIVIGTDGLGLGQATAVPTTGLETAVPDATATLAVGSGNGSVDTGDVNATIEDMIVDTDTGDIQYLVLDTNFTDGERWIPVPLGFLQWDSTSQLFVVKVNANALQNAPFFEGDQFPDTTIDGWDSDFSDFWNNQ